MPLPCISCRVSVTSAFGSVFVRVFVSTINDSPDAGRCRGTRERSEKASHQWRATEAGRCPSWPALNANAPSAAHRCRLIINQSAAAVESRIRSNAAPRAADELRESSTACRNRPLEWSHVGGWVWGDPSQHLPTPTVW